MGHRKTHNFTCIENKPYFLNVLLDLQEVYQMEKPGFSISGKIRSFILHKYGGGPFDFKSWTMV